MKCIKNRCKYYCGHPFYSSVFTCSLDFRSFDGESNIECCIEGCLEESLKYFKELKMARYKILMINSKERNNETETPKTQEKM